MQSWREINEAIAACRRSSNPVSCLAALFERNRDGHVAAALAEQYERLGRIEEARRWFNTKLARTARYVALVDRQREPSTIDPRRVAVVFQNKESFLLRYSNRLVSFEVHNGRGGTVRVQNGDCLRDLSNLLVAKGKARQWLIVPYARTLQFVHQLFKNSDPRQHLLMLLHLHRWEGVFIDNP